MSSEAITATRCCRTDAPTSSGSGILHRSWRDPLRNVSLLHCRREHASLVPVYGLADWSQQQAIATALLRCRRLWSEDVPAVSALARVNVTDIGCARKSCLSRGQRRLRRPGVHVPRSARAGARDAAESADEGQYNPCHVRFVQYKYQTSNSHAIFNRETKHDETADHCPDDRRR